MTARSTGSTPRDWLGGPATKSQFQGLSSEGDLYIPSMRMLMNRICMAFNGLLKPRSVLQVMSDNYSAISAHVGPTVDTKKTYCSHSRTQLETDEVLDVVEDGFAYDACEHAKNFRVTSHTHLPPPQEAAS